MTVGVMKTGDQCLRAKRSVADQRIAAELMKISALSLKSFPLC